MEVNSQECLTRDRWVDSSSALTEAYVRCVCLRSCASPPAGALAHRQVRPDVTYLYGAGSRVEDEVNPHTAEFGVPFE